jgi:hypothetical protein
VWDGQDMYEIEGKEIFLGFFLGKTRRKKPLERPRHKCEDNI